jgi:uncharacterized cupin superfamily protein
VKIVNLFAEDWDRVEEREGFRARDMWVGAKLDAELIGGSVYELDPGEKTWPYHLHHANEEWLIVLRGKPTLRAPDGERELEEGDVACFPRGPDGAHQVINRTDETARVLIISTMVTPEIVEYPDSGKLAARDAKGGRLALIRPGPQLDYWDGE